jgi:two-component system response regulator TctD
MKLLLVEDEPAMRQTLVRALGNRGFQPRACADGDEALAAWHAGLYDVVVLDLSLPGRDGLEVLREARAAGLREPVLILTARGTVGDRVIGLNTGADDYLAKPFDLDELEARLRALARRHAPAHEAAPRMQHAGTLALDRDNGAVYHGGEVLELPPRELALLQALLASPGKAVSKERLFTLVFPHQAEVQYEAIEVVAYRLRKKLAGTGASVVTLRGLGYLLKVDA